MTATLQTLTRYWNRFFRYDEIEATEEISCQLNGKHRWLVTAAIPASFVLIALIFIMARLVDNQGHVCSSSLPHIHGIAQNPLKWLKGGMWWSAGTPVPMHNFSLALVFTVFGYDTRFAMVATCLLSAAGCLLLGEITRRRFGYAAALIAQVLYITTPVILQYSLSGGYYIWGSTPLLLCIYFLDLNQSKQKTRYYLLAAVALLCAGMSRPEVFALAIPIAILVPIAFRYRPAFLGISWLYPVASVIYFRIHDLPTPGAIKSRLFEGLGMALSIWFVEVYKVLTNAIGSEVLLAMTILATVIFAFRKTRFLSLFVLAYLMLFLALHMVGRLEKNFEWYYIGPVILLLPIASGMIVESVTRLKAFLIRRNYATLGRIATVLLCCAFIWLLNPTQRADLLAERFTYKVDESVRAVRDYIRENADPKSNIVLDYSEDVTWLKAELTGTEDRYIWAYYINHEPRPLQRPPATAEEFIELNDYIASGFFHWVERMNPRWLVTVNDRKWLSALEIIHYKMYALRRALRRKSFHDGSTIDLGDEYLTLKTAFSGKEYSVFRLEYSSASQSEPELTKNLLKNGAFTKWSGSGPQNWKIIHGALVFPETDPDMGAVAAVSPRSPTDSAAIVQIVKIAPSMLDRIWRLRVVSKSDGPKKHGANLYYVVNGKRCVIQLSHPGDGQWHTIERDFALPANTDSETLELLLLCRPGIRSPVLIADVFLGLVN